MHSSDSDTSTDSEKGIRFKTDSTRHKNKQSGSIKRERSSSQTRYDRSLKHDEIERHKRKKEKKHKRKNESKSEQQREHPKETNITPSLNSRGEKAQTFSPDLSHSSKLVDNSTRTETEKIKQRVQEHDSTFGPTLPPHLTNKDLAKQPNINNETIHKTYSIGPMLPPHLIEKSVNQQDVDTDETETGKIIGPALPSIKKQIEEQSDTFFGPALPLHLFSNDSSKQAQKTNESKSQKATIGPMLPPHLIEKSINQQDVDTDETETGKIIGPALPPIKKQIEERSDTSFGPALPLHLSSNDAAKPADITNESKFQKATIGPMLPPHLIKDSKNQQDVADTGTPQIMGPVLPPHLQNTAEEAPKKIFGPACPPHLQKTISETNKTENDGRPNENVIGPTLPPHLRQQLAEAASCAIEYNEEEDDAYGPLPMGAALSKSHIELEERALQMKINQLNPQGDDEPKREEWMLELPAVKAANLGLGPRSFRMKGTPDLSDRSSWTDTPQEKANKKKGNVDSHVDLEKEAEMKALRKRDREQEEIVKKSKRSSDSLVDMHRKKLKEKKKDDSAPTERRPFSRDVDLQVNKFDEAQKKAILKKAQLLDDRFSSGKSKFL